jgi:YVTN family beta-propeller protein
MIRRIPGAYLRVTVPVLQLLIVAAMVARGDEQEQLRLGVQPDGRIVVPTNQILRSAGKQLTFPGRPVDLVLVEDGQTLVLKNMHDLVFVDTATARIKQVLPLPRKNRDDRTGFSVHGLLAHGNEIFATDSQDQVRSARSGTGGMFAWERSLPVPAPRAGGPAYPAGLGLDREKRLWVACSRGNCVARFDLADGRVLDTVPVGVAPYDVCCAPNGRCYVSNWGGDPPRPGEAEANTSGTPVRVDAVTRVANNGTISVLEEVGGKWQPRRSITVGLHPCAMILGPRGRLLYVANANSDTVSVIDTTNDTVLETIACRPEGRLPFGSGSNALTLSRDGATLYVANGTNNCVAVIQLGARSSEESSSAKVGLSLVAGLIPTGWYPGALRLTADGRTLAVANVKGVGSLARQRPGEGHARPLEKGMNSHDFLGSVSFIDVPDRGALKRYTAEVNSNNRLAYSLSGLDAARPGARAVPVPGRHGEPSPIKHVLYIIKENRTYDQVFGDMKEGNGDSRLVMFGENVTPNHHALAREFTLFDNFYCSGVLSADGHSWTDAAYVTDYLEKAFGQFTRSYPDDGSDALAFAPTGFLWDNALGHKKSLRNYGEFVTELPYTPLGTKWMDLYLDHKNGTRKVKVTPHASMKSIEPYTHPTYPYFPLTAPDAYRADLFIADFKEFEKRGILPNLLTMSLPCDHTEGTTPDFPTPRAMVADNDLALGRIVETVSHSKFWKETAIFVVEDDPQNGFDHVDGHRTVALVISPYTRRHFVDHTNYNQTSMVKTIELVLGLPPMNQLDLSATAMRACFQEELNLTPYQHRSNKILLTEMNPPLKELKGVALHWAKKSLELNLDKADAADEDTFNRIIWHATRGYETPYPAEYTNAGRGRPPDDD